MHIYFHAAKPMLAETHAFVKLTAASRSGDRPLYRKKLAAWNRMKRRLLRG
jgi:hypothetical protein